MVTREGDLARYVLHCLVFLLGICGIEGTVHIPLIFHSRTPLVPSSPPAKEHKSLGSLSHRQGSQHPDIFRSPGKDLSPSSANPPNHAEREKPVVPTAKTAPLSSPDSLSNAPRLTPSMTPLLGNRAPMMMIPVAAPLVGKSSPPPLWPLLPIPRKKGRHSPPPLNAGRPSTSPAPVIHPPIEVPMNSRWNIASPPIVDAPEVDLAPSPPQNNKRKPRVEGPYFPPGQGPIYYPALSPKHFRGKSQSPLQPPIRSLPPPLPNLDCASLTCQEPLANPPPGSPCSCVMPIKIGLRVGIALYTFFPLVSEFAREITSGIFVKQSQVRIMGANSDSEDIEKTLVLVELVPVRRCFENTTAFLIYEKFWRKEVAIETSYFGGYEVLYLFYPGLPSPPPTALPYINIEGAYDNSNNGQQIRPLGVDVRKQKGKHRLNGLPIVIVILSAVITLALVVLAVCFLFLRPGHHSEVPGPSSETPIAKLSEKIAARGSRQNSTSAFLSSIATYAGTAKIFSLFELGKATNNFNESKIIGEGGFGRVYEGVFEDGTRVAVKVLKRDDRQGEREFLAEVELLGRLHHRNLVKLMGICAEENARCLVYELVPNGSLESHLHGIDKDSVRLDWSTRMKIALGAARGLAYLHEDSVPCIIHRDFKSSNILLKHDYTPKVSDFGLAKAALEKQNEYISTRVMGTFGYVAPEYAMTGHLLVKSDVYSYGVVLLELLTGRKPIDMTQPPGQENLVAWARLLRAKQDGLERIIDPALDGDYPRDGVFKVAAIALMCVEPEVSFRPFMGEVVQALRLVCDESGESMRLEGGDKDLSSMKNSEIATNICQGREGGASHLDVMHSSEEFTFDGLLGKHSSSCPLRTSEKRHFWRRIRDAAAGTASEHRFTHKFRSRSEHGGRWP